MRVAVTGPRLPLCRKGERVKTDFGDLVLLSEGDRSWVFDAQRQLLAPVGHGLPQAVEAVLGGGIYLEVAGKYRQQLSRSFDLSRVEKDLPQVISPQVIVTFEGSLNHLEAELEFDYGNPSISFLKDEEEEAQARAFLREWGFEKIRKNFALKSKEEIVRFHAYGREQVPADWIVREGERYRHAAGQVVEVSPEMTFTSSGEDWFGVNLGYRSSNGNVLAAAEVRRIFQGGDGGQRSLPDGRVVVMAESAAREVEETMRDLEGMQSGGGVMRVDAAQAGYLREVANEGLVKANGDLPWKEEQWDWDLGPGGKLLRDYQRLGTEWMLNLSTLSLIHI